MPTIPDATPAKPLDLTGFPTDEDRDRLRKRLSDEAPVWEEQFSSGPGVVMALEDAVIIAARVVAAERRKAFNEGAVTGMRLQAHG